MRLFNFYLKYFFVLFFLATSQAFSNNLKFEGLSILTMDDIQSLTVVDIYKEQISEMELDSITKDLYESDLIYDLNLYIDNDTNFFSIIENDLIEDIYFNGNVRIKNKQLYSLIDSKINFYLSKDQLKNDISYIKNFYNSLGYIDNSVEVKKEFYSDNRVNLIFEISEGSRYKITDLKFFGNTSFSDKFLYSKINTKTLSSYNIFKSGSNFVKELFDFDLVSLNNFYKQKGFFDVKIDYRLKRRRTADFQLSYYIDEGERYLIDEINYDFTFFDNSVNDIDALILKFEKKINKNDNFFDYNLVSEYVDLINLDFKKNGLYDIEASHTFDKIDGLNVLNFFDIQLDKKYINKINISGNSITKDKTLRSKIEIEPGDLFSSYRINKDIESLKNLKYINDAKAEMQELNDLVDISYDLIENKKSGEFMIGGSYSADVGVGLALNLKDSNFQGSGNEIEFTFNGNTEKLLYSLYYNSYGELNSYQTNSYSISNEETDLSGSFGYKIKNLSIGYGRSLRVDENLSTFVGIGFSQIEGYDPVLDIDFINENIDSYNQTDLNFNINFDNTDDIFFPTKGIRSSLSLLVSPEGLSKDAFFKVIMQYDQYKSFKDSDRYLFTVNDLGIADSYNSNLRTINSFSLGGSNFKGFDYRGIGPKSNGAYLGGNSFFTNTVGYGGSFLFDEKDNINLRLFHTIGSIWGSDYTSDNEFKLRSSVGLSLDFLSQVGPISLSYAIPIEKEQSDISREFNFTLGASF
ncbi:outer membrane protein assembly factor BamA [Alphaproteobacteria bacterium]|nr:outer membrane protein assembly factor BamA [Alphaproteobacteria bacterium]